MNKQFLLLISSLFLSVCLFSQSDFSLVDSIQRLNMRAQDSSQNLFKRKRQANLALKLSKTIDYNLGAYKAARELAHIHLKQNQYQDALQAFLEADVAAGELDNLQYSATNALSLGKLFIEIDNTEAALAYFVEAESYYDQVNDTVALGSIYSGIGNVMSHRGEREKALEYFIRALSMYDQPKYNAYKTAPLLQIGENYQAIDIPDLSLQYFQRAYKLATQYSNHAYQTRALGKLAMTYIILNKNAKADSLLQEAIVLSRKHELNRIRASIYKELAETYQATDNYKQAFEAYQEYTRMKDSLQLNQIQSEVAALQVEYETEKKEKELLASQSKILQLEQKNKISQLWVLLFTLGLLSLLVVIYLIGSRHRIQQQLVESDLKAREMESKALKRELDFKNRDLTNLAIDISRKNEFATEVQDKLHELEKKAPAEFKKTIREIIHFTTSHAKINEDLEKLQLNTAKVNQEFFNKLRDYYPDLTKNERNLCGLIRLNLSTKEIAAIKNITPKSVEMIRYRLRKKLNLKPRANVAAFLQSL